MQPQQQIQTAEKTKKFGRYVVSREVKRHDRETILFEDNVVDDIRNILNKKAPDVIQLDHIPNEYDSSDKFFYHIKDSTVRFARQNDEYLLSINHKTLHFTTY